MILRNRFPRSVLPVLLVLTAALCVPAQARGQEWKCIAPSDCGALVPSGNTVSFALRLEQTPITPAPGRNVRIRLTDGVLYVGGLPLAPGEGGLLHTKTDSRGMLEGYVLGAKSGQEIIIDGEARPDVFVSKTLRVAAPVVLHRSTPDFVRYAGTQSWDVSVYANGLDDEACRRSVVRFTPRGGTGSVSIDSVFGENRNVPGGRACFYNTDWRLGNEVGRQVLLARAGTAPPVEISAIARRRPGLRVGLGMALRRGDFATLQNPRAGEKIRVRRLTPDGYVEYDSIPKGRIVDTLPSWRPEAMPLILLDGPAPLLLRKTTLRMSIGASAINVRRDFFVGLAIQQLWYGVQSEDNGFDLQLGALISRPERLTNPALCGRDLAADRPQSELDVSCDTRESLRFDGFVGTVSTDAQSLVTGLAKMLGFG